MRRLGEELKVVKGEKMRGKKEEKKRIGSTVGCVLKISHAQQPVRTLQREITQPCRQKRKEEIEKKSKKKKLVTSLPILCGSVLGGSVLRAGASGEQRGEEEGKRPLQAQSKTAIVVLKDRGTPPSCERRIKIWVCPHQWGVYNYPCRPI